MKNKNLAQAFLESSDHEIIFLQNIGHVSFSDDLAVITPVMLIENRFYLEEKQGQSGNNQLPFFMRIDIKYTKLSWKSRWFYSREVSSFLDTQRQFPYSLCTKKGLHITCFYYTGKNYEN